MRQAFWIAVTALLAWVTMARGQQELVDAPQVPAPCPQPSDRFWADAEYLLWFTKNSEIPPLFTTGSPFDAPPAALGRPGTAVLFGPDVDQGVRPGGRFSTGYWFDDCHRFGLDGSFFFLAQDSVAFRATSDGSAGSGVLAIPYLDVTPNSFTNGQNTILLALPGVSAGSAQAFISSNLQSADVNGRSRVLRGTSGYVDVLGGFRYLRLSEALDLSADATTIDDPFNVVSLSTSSGFATRNHFYGGQLGTEAELTCGCWFLDLRSKLALGDNHETALVDGSFTFNARGQSTTVQSGPFAMPSNIGSHSHDTFSFVPEIGIDLGYQIGNHLRAKCGYSLLYWTDVVRPGDQIDAAMNMSQLQAPLGPGALTGPARPAMSFKETDFWAQGVSLGVEFRY
jgi:hypothetical protein